MNKLVDYFGSSVERLGAFYPTYCLVAIFRNLADAEATLHKLLSAGFAPTDAIAADGKAVLQFDKDEKDLARFILQAISRFFATEQVFADHDLEDARHGAGFLAVRCPTDDLKNAAWRLSNPKYRLTRAITRVWGSIISLVITRPTKERKTNKGENMTTVNAAMKRAQIRVTRRSPAYWRVTIDNPPINVMGPEMVRQFQEVINALEADEDVRVVVFDSAVDDYFLNHSDFMAKLEDLTSMPAGPTGLPPWPDFLVRLTRVPVASIALIRGRATGNGSEITLACDMSFASREKAIISQWEVGVGMVAGGGPMARLPGTHRPKPRARGALELGRHQGRAGRGIRLRESRPARRRSRRVRRGARDADRQVRQMGDRQHQAAGQHQPAAGRRARRRVGCVHRFARATCRPGGDQGADGARLPQAGGCRKSARILPGPNRA